MFGGPSNFFFTPVGEEDRRDSNVISTVAEGAWIRSSEDDTAPLTTYSPIRRRAKRQQQQQPQQEAPTNVAPGGSLRPDTSVTAMSNSNYDASHRSSVALSASGALFGPLPPACGMPTSPVVSRSSLSVASAADGGAVPPPASVSRSSVATGGGGGESPESPASDDSSTKGGRSGPEVRREVWDIDVRRRMFQRYPSLLEDKTTERDVRIKYRLLTDEGVQRPRPATPLHVVFRRIRNETRLRSMASAIFAILFVVRLKQTLQSTTVQERVLGRRQQGEMRKAAKDRVLARKFYGASARSMSLHVKKQRSAMKTVLAAGIEQSQKRLAVTKFDRRVRCAGQEMATDDSNGPTAAGGGASGVPHHHHHHRSYRHQPAPRQGDENDPLSKSELFKVRAAPSEDHLFDRTRYDNSFRQAQTGDGEQIPLYLRQSSFVGVVNQLGGRGGSRRGAAGGGADDSRRSSRVGDDDSRRTSNVTVNIHEFGEFLFDSNANIALLSGGVDEKELRGDDGSRRASAAADDHHDAVEHHQQRQPAARKRSTRTTAVSFSAGQDDDEEQQQQQQQLQQQRNENVEASGDVAVRFINDDEEDEENEVKENSDNNNNDNSGMGDVSVSSTVNPDEFAAAREAVQSIAAAAHSIEGVTDYKLIRTQSSLVAKAAANKLPATRNIFLWHFCWRDEPFEPPHPSLPSLSAAGSARTTLRERDATKYVSQVHTSELEAFAGTKESPALVDDLVALRNCFASDFSGAQHGGGAGAADSNSSTRQPASARKQQKRSTQYLPHPLSGGSSGRHDRPLSIRQQVQQQILGEAVDAEDGHLHSSSNNNSQSFPSPPAPHRGGGRYHQMRRSPVHSGASSPRKEALIAAKTSASFEPFSLHYGMEHSQFVRRSIKELSRQLDAHREIYNQKRRMLIERDAFVRRHEQHIKRVDNSVRQSLTGKCDGDIRKYCVDWFMRLKNKVAGVMNGGLSAPMLAVFDAFEPVFQNGVLTPQLFERTTILKLYGRYLLDAVAARSSTLESPQQQSHQRRQQRDSDDDAEVENHNHDHHHIDNSDIVADTTRHHGDDDEEDSSTSHMRDDLALLDAFTQTQSVNHGDNISKKKTNRNDALVHPSVGEILARDGASTDKFNDFTARVPALLDGLIVAPTGEECALVDLGAQFVLMRIRVAFGVSQPRTKELIVRSGATYALLQPNEVDAIYRHEAAAQRAKELGITRVKRLGLLDDVIERTTRIDRMVEEGKTLEERRLADRREITDALLKQQDKRGGGPDSAMASAASSLRLPPIHAPAPPNTSRPAGRFGASISSSSFAPPLHHARTARGK